MKRTAQMPRDSFDECHSGVRQIGAAMLPCAFDVENRNRES
jgi:hypothetical protein